MEIYRKPYSGKMSFGKLEKTICSGCFNPETSKAACSVLRSFKKSAFVQEISKKYNVKAEFSRIMPQKNKIDEILEIFDIYPIATESDTCISSLTLKIKQDKQKSRLERFLSIFKRNKEDVMVYKLSDISSYRKTAPDDDLYGLSMLIQGDKTNIETVDNFFKNCENKTSYT